MSTCRALLSVPLFFLLACGAGPADDASDPKVGDDKENGGGSLPAAPTGTTSPTAPPTGTSPTPPPSTGKATLKLLTYNVAGLPQGLSSSNPQVNTPQISPKLNPYELVVVQEDFAYHPQLASKSTHPHKSTPMTAPSPVDLGDGLNVFSRAPISTPVRTKWAKCNGTFDQKNDCLTSKGFVRFTLDVGPGMQVDVYDAHFDAGRSDGDADARDAQAAQLVAAIAANSANRAVIVAGDTNMKDTDETTLQALLTGAKLTDACRALTCPEATRIDRVMFRSSSTVKIAAKTWRVETSFVDGSGNQLSDHEPVSVELTIEK